MTDIDRFDRAFLDELLSYLPINYAALPRTSEGFDYSARLKCIRSHDMSLLESFIGADFKKNPPSFDEWLASL